MLSQHCNRSTRRHKTTSSRKSVFLACCLAIFCILSFSVEVVIADADYDYVKEVLEEEQQHYGDEYSSHDSTPQESPEEILRKQQEQARLKQEEQERLRAEKLAQDRERAFQKELAKLDEEQRKTALKQKKKDARLVKSILKLSQQSTSQPDRKTGLMRVPNYYKILGIHNWNLYLPQRKLEVGPVKVTFPGITIKKTSQKDIRKAFRTRTKLVHPDKNKDGFAHEAFLAVEHAASILSDEKARKEYDGQLKAWQQAQRQQQQELILKVWRTFRNTVKTISKILGPFATPIFILGAIII